MTNFSSSFSPRNHWQSIALALEHLAEGRANEAWGLIDMIRHSQLVGSDALLDLDTLLRESLSDQRMRRLQRPSDYMRHAAGHAPQPHFRKLAATRKPVKEAPYEMVLPPLTGNGNDFSFVVDTALRYGFSAPVPELSLRLVTQVQNGAEAELLASGLAARQQDLARLPGGISICVFAPVHLHGRPLGLRANWQEGQPWRLGREAQLATMAESEADVLLFLPALALTDALLPERVLRYMALSTNLCLTLTPLPKQDDPAQADQRLTVLADQVLQGPARSKHTAFRQLETLGFAVEAARFRDLGGFDPRFTSERFACREFAFRLFNQGAYFLPLALRADLPVPDRSVDDMADKRLLTTLCPHPWDRKVGGCFEVPRVSIYIPAWRAARYLGEAIDSVLEQDYEDLEICVADDGSPDDTLRVLESYADEPRLRWITGLNGGIGCASNRGIRMARGLYIGQLDSDDRLKPGAVRRLAEYLDMNPLTGCVYASCERIDRRGVFIQNEYNFPVFTREKMMVTSIAHHFRMFRRQVWCRTEGFREDIVNGVDYDIFLKMSELSEFHHINEILYQRRWHGDNTSHVNESFQTQNTYRVQRDALARQGLDRYWDVHVPDPAVPRAVTYKRKGSENRVIFWPDYSRANPYQRLLYAKASENTDILGGDIDAALRAVREVSAGDGGQVTFHLHWLNKLLEGATTAGQAADITRDFLTKLRDFRRAGGRLVWTIHNLASHDLPFPKVERQLAREIIEIADAVHVHSAASLPEIAAHFSVPSEKLHIMRHGAYIGAYPDFVDRDRARQELGLSPADDVVLFLGQIRPYKGIDTLVGAIRQIQQERPRLRLVLAGGGPGGLARQFLQEAAQNGLDLSRVILFDRFIDNMELQLFLRSADFAVFPYRNILTSGSLLLALSYGVPCVVPDYGMTREVMDDCKAGLLFPSRAGAEELAEVLRSMLSKIDAGEGASMGAAARLIAEAEPWEDIGPILFGTSQ